MKREMVRKKVIRDGGLRKLFVGRGTPQLQVGGGDSAEDLLEPRYKGVQVPEIVVELKRDGINLRMISGHVRRLIRRLAFDAPHVPCGIDPEVPQQ